MIMKLMSCCLFTSLLMSLALLSSCGDDSTSSPSKEEFSFKLTVVDQNGAPLRDLTLSRRCSIEYDGVPAEKGMVETQILTGRNVGFLSVSESAPGADPPTEFFLYPASPNPGTTNASITLDVPVASDVSVSVFNWKNLEMFTSSLSVPGGGLVMVIYPFTDGGSDYQPNGIFSCEYTATEPDDSTILFQDSVYFSGYTGNDPYRQSMGQTDIDGSFKTTDKGYFPSLQGHQPQMGRDLAGRQMNLFSFSRTVEIKVLSEPLLGMEGYIYWMTRDVAISGGTNELEWVFVPDDSVAVIVE